MDNISPEKRDFFSQRVLKSEKLLNCKLIFQYEAHYLNGIDLFNLSPHTEHIRH